MFCGNCGTKIREGAAFCHVCGRPCAPSAEPELVPVSETAKKTVEEPALPVTKAPAPEKLETAADVTEPEIAPLSPVEEETVAETPEILDKSEENEASADTVEEAPVPELTPIPEETAEPVRSSVESAAEIPVPEEAPMTEPSSPEPPIVETATPVAVPPETPGNVSKPRSGIVLTVFACVFAVALLVLLYFPWFRLVPGDDITESSTVNKAFTALVGEGEYGLSEITDLTSDWTKASLYTLSVVSVSGVLNTVSLVMDQILLPIASFFRMISVLGIFFYIASAIMKRKDAKKLGRAAFNGAILSSIIAILLPIILAIILPSDWPVSLSATMFPYITLLVAVCGRLFMLKSLYPEMSEKTSDYDTRHLILAPVVVFLSISVYTEFLIPYIYRLSFGTDVAVASSVLFLLRPVVLPLSVIGGLFLIFFGKRLKRRTSVGILSAVTLLVGLAAMLLSVFTDLQAIGLPEAAMDPAKSLLRISSFALIFQPYALYQAVFCYKKGRWWTHILIAVFMVVVQYGLLVVAAVILRSYLLLPLTTLLTHLLLTGILLLVLLPERRKKEKKAVN